NAMALEKEGAVVHLHGTLGAGKTTFVRGFLRGFDYSGAVKSPTYTLVEPYELAAINVYHFDLYRLGNAEEMDFLGTESYFAPDNICLFEWAERGSGYIPDADLAITLEVSGSGRDLLCRSNSEKGARLAKRMWE
ncbi:MAG: tRNA (adenosine(37)-N6)-threonylcarbamoyltransferase complex ATPase subunit type 1 TsaE, partial [Gammaproteobacteria bacterium]